MSVKIANIANGLIEAVSSKVARLPALVTGLLIDAIGCQMAWLETIAANSRVA